jgi:hypothetical protein
MEKLHHFDWNPVKVWKVHHEICSSSEAQSYRDIIHSEMRWATSLSCRRAINFKSTKLDLSIIIRDLYSGVLPRAKTLISEEMIVIMNCQG